MPIWDDLIPPSDTGKYRTYRQLQQVGFGVRPAVVVVDMTESFIDERFSTGCGEPARQAVKATADLLHHARQKGIPRVFAVWDPGTNSEELGFWKCQATRPVRGGRGLPDPLALPAILGRRRDEPILRRAKPSAFFGTQLASVLTFRQVDTILVAGISTSGCVRATVIDAFSYNYRVIVPEECVADRASIPHKVNLFDMHMKYADVVPLDKVVAYLEGLQARQGKYGALRVIHPGAGPSRRDDGRPTARRRAVGKSA